VSAAVEAQLRKNSPGGIEVFDVVELVAFQQLPAPAEDAAGSFEE